MLVSTAFLLMLSGGMTVLYLIFKLNDTDKAYKAFYSNPTPFYVPLLGNTLYYFRKNILSATLSIVNKLGKRCIIYLPHRTYVTSDPEEIKIILNKTVEKSKEYDHLKIVFGNCLLLAKGPIWKKNRKLISKSFNKNLLDSFIPVFYENSNELLNILEKKKYSNIIQLLEHFTFDNFFETTLGVKTGTLYKEKDEVVNCITEGQKVLYNRVGNVLKMNDFLFSWMPDGRALKNMIGIGLNFFGGKIIQRKRTIKEENEIILDSRELTVVDLLLSVAKSKNLTNEYIRHELMFLAAAATDTSAYSMAYTLCLLAMHPTIQERVYNEIMTEIGVCEITINHLTKLKYTERALNEALRLLPVIPFIGRQTTSDLDIGTSIIPPDTGIIINILNLHRDETVYPDPLKYDPDRFLPENIAKRHSYSYLPFSGGPRNCIGWKYAQMGMKTVIANIIRNFEVTTPYKSILDLDFESSVVMNTTHPLEINFIKRDKSED